MQLSSQSEGFWIASLTLAMTEFMVREGLGSHVYLPWQCLYFLPEPHGQASLRPILPQVFGSLGSRSATSANNGAATRLTSAEENPPPPIGSEMSPKPASFRPVCGSRCWNCIGGGAGSGC